MNMSDRLAILNHGRIEQIGVPREVYERPANRFVGRFLGEANLIPGSLVRVSGSEAVVRTADGREYRARARPGVVDGAEVALFARPERIALTAAGADGAANGSNRAEGRVYRRSFLGGMMRCVVEIAPELRLTVDIPNVGDARIPEIDERVGLAWAVADSLILPG